MRNTDLMIGDWIFYPNNTPQKITGLAPGIDENGNIHYQFFNDVEWYELEKAKPIPLTPEILEKNRFSLEHYSGNIMIGNWWTREDFVFHENRNDSVGRNNFKYEYVHQLQHALKLCGIEKEIVL